MASRDSRAKDPLYSRKEKSLGVLCSNFLRLYNRDGVDSVGLDSAALQLGVERRRIYDIVNILESVGVLKRKAKNQYSYKGLDAIPGALEILKEQGLQEKFDTCIADVSYRKECRLPINSKTDSQDNSESDKSEHRREKSLGLLTQNFVKLFLSSDVDLISLDRAALALLGDSRDPTAMRTKIRRLYDIANVFSSMGLIEKTRDPRSGKPAFRWIGLERNSRHESFAALDVKNSKRRVFGTEITNTMVKRCNTNSSIDWKPQSIETENMGKPDKQDKPKEWKAEISTEKHPKYGAKAFVFGPFPPPNAINTEAYKNERQIQDLENLSQTYRPQYRNQVLWQSSAIFFIIILRHGSPGMLNLQTRSRLNLDPNSLFTFNFPNLRLQTNCLLCRIILI